MTKEEQLEQKIKNYVLSLFEGIEETPTKEEKEWLESCLYLFAEPREKRIAELERKLEQTEKDLADYQFNYPTIKELEAQIEKMKCCCNCKHSRTEYEHCETDELEKWEIKEK